MKADEDVFREWARKAKKLVDVGSQKGLFTRMADEEMRGGTVYSFDPDSRWDPPAFPKESTNLLVHRHVALGAKPGRAKLWIETTGCMLDIRKKKNYKVVDVETLDTAVPFGVDLIKIDVEGYEEDVLRGATQHLERGTPIYLELHKGFIEQAGRSVEDVMQILEAHHYNCELLCESGADNWADLYWYLCTT